jgi:hypothetical protein
MPNWCNNVATISHSNPKKIKRLVQAFQGTGLMQEFYPCPKELLDTRSGAYAKDDPEYDRHIQQQADNKAKYGHADWYDWKVDNWGTKWDVSQQHPSHVDMSPCGKTVTLSFDTAWSPPINFYEHMIQEHGFRIKAYYFEPGVGFCGRWHNGDDDFYDIVGDSSWVVDHVPNDIDEAFAISEHMSDYEAEEEEYEEEEEDEEEVSDDA